MKKFILFSIIATLFVIKAIAGTASGSLTVSIIFPDNKLTATSIHSISPPSSLTSFSPEVADYFFNDNNKVILRLWNPKEETDGVQLVYKIIDMGSGDIIKKYVVNDLSIEPFSMIRIELPASYDNAMFTASVIHRGELMQTLALRN